VDNAAVTASGRRKARVRWRLVCILSASGFLMLVGALFLLLEFGYCQWHPYIYMWQTMRGTGRNNIPRGYTGAWRSWFVFGDKRFTEFRNGKGHGLDIYWNANGSRRFQDELRDGVPHGAAITWHDNGRLSHVYRCEYDKKDGAGVSWHSNGQLASLFQYRCGTITGRALVWDSKGQLIADGVWRDGRPWDGSVLMRDWKRDGDEVFTYREGVEVARKPAPQDAPPAPALAEHREVPAANRQE